MLEFLAGGGQFIAIAALCYSCWLFGRSARNGSGEPNDPAARRDGGSERELPGPDTGESLSEFEDFAGMDTQSDPIERGHAQAVTIARRAAEVRALIKTGDLSQEGVLESLVAMAEEQASKDKSIPQPAWKSRVFTSLDREFCDQPRILTRKADMPEPLPAELPDPITPKVLQRYRMFAQDFS